MIKSTGYVMRLHSLLAWLLLPLASVVFAAGVPAGESTWIVSFEEPPLASFAGFDGSNDPRLKALEATSPARTGAARLDVDAPAARAYRAYLSERRATWLREASAALGRTLEPQASFDVVNHAVVLQLDAAEASALAVLPGVARVEADWVDHPQTDAGPLWIGADRIWSGVEGVASRGAGVVVGVIDSGINRTHPSFAASGPVDGHVHVNPRGNFFGLCASNASLCNAKLIGIHDFTVCTGNHNSEGCDDREANDGRDQSGHGSHVAGIAVGNTVDVPFTVASGSVTRRASGVAPHANLIAYKACEEEESCRGSWLVAAINQAVADGVDVINYSIGGSPRDPWTSSDALAMLAAREAGVLVVVSAGNAGPEPGTVSAPANSPWVLAAANSTHDRATVNRLVDLTGGASAPPSGGILLGVGSTVGYGPAPLLVPSDHPQCSTGSDLDFPPSGVSNPWSPGRFNGEIVVCERGTQARVAKSNNVRLAGGGGTVLTNLASDGESIVADEHSLPGTHVGFLDGSALRAWLAGGSGHRGRIEGAQVRQEPELADLLNASSSRGPVAAGGFLKPNLSAPGTSVVAAAGSGNGFALRSGTSMAAPHLAGAAALLRAIRPQWSVSDIEAALATTASPSVRASDGSRLATALEQGSGRIALPAAQRAGLGFEIAPAQFRNARPSAGGEPRNLNQPSLLHQACFERCSLVRQARDLRGGGRWRAEVDAPAGLAIAVEPAEFELGAGATVALQFEFTITDARLAGRWLDAAVRLVAVDGAASTARLPVSLFASPGALPERILLNVDSDRGFRDIALSGLIGLDDLTLLPSTMVEPTLRSEVMVQDPTNTQIYDSFGTGTFFSLVQVPGDGGGAPRRFRLIAIADSTAARDIDLYVGRDADGDGQPEQAEERCRSTSAQASERCEVDIASTAAPQSWWVLVQNWQSASTGSSDFVQLETALIELGIGDGGDLVATAPATVSRLDPFMVRLAWEAPVLIPGQRRLGVLELAAAGDASQPFATLPVELERFAPAGHAARALASGRSQRLRLSPQTAADRLFIEVPANASALVARSTGSGEVDLYAARAADPADPALTTIAAAPPREQAAASARGPGANKQLRVDGAALSAGRWYLTPVNTGGALAEIELEVVVETAAEAQRPRFGAWFNPARSGAGAFLFAVQGQWGYAWYGYLQDGSPTWYLGAAPAPAAGQGIWRVDVLRYRWNGERAIGTPVGEVLLAFEDAESMRVSWSLDGQSGSERLRWVDGGSCPEVDGQARDLTGLWFSPDRPGFGYSVNAYAGLESNGAYFYDARGIARWAFGSTGPFGADSFALDFRRGSCPLCAYAPPVVTPEVGLFERRYDGDASGQMAVDLALPAPLFGDWQVDLPVIKLSDPVGCP